MNVPSKLIILLFLLNVVVIGSGKICKKKLNFCVNSKCDCPEGSKPNKNKTCCVYNCEDKCFGGKCVGKNKCKCLPGYKPTKISNVCEPFCSDCLDGFCYDYEKCAERKFINKSNQTKLQCDLETFSPHSTETSIQEDLVVKDNKSMSSTRFPEESHTETSSTPNENNLIILNVSETLHYTDTYDDKKQQISNGSEKNIDTLNETSAQTTKSTPILNTINTKSTPLKTFETTPKPDTQDLWKAELIIHRNQPDQEEAFEEEIQLITNSKQDLTQQLFENNKDYYQLLAVAAVPLGIGLILVIIIFGLAIRSHFQCQHPYNKL